MGFNSGFKGLNRQQGGFRAGLEALEKREYFAPARTFRNLVSVSTKIFRLFIPRQWTQQVDINLYFSPPVGDSNSPE